MSDRHPHTYTHHNAHLSLERLLSFLDPLLLLHHGPARLGLLAAHLLKGLLMLLLLLAQADEGLVLVPNRLGVFVKGLLYVVEPEEDAPQN